MNHSVQTLQIKDLIVPSEYMRESHFRKSLFCSLSSTAWTDRSKTIKWLSFSLSSYQLVMGYVVLHGRAESRIGFKLFCLSLKQACGWSCLNLSEFLPSPPTLNDQDSTHESKFWFKTRQTSLKLITRRDSTSLLFLFNLILKSQSESPTVPGSFPSGFCEVLINWLILWACEIGTGMC